MDGLKTNVLAIWLSATFYATKMFSLIFVDSLWMRPIKIRTSIKPAQSKINQYLPLSFSIYFGWEKLGQWFSTSGVMSEGIR